jgi:hypothetical protein
LTPRPVGSKMAADREVCFARRPHRAETVYGSGTGSRPPSSASRCVTRQAFTRRRGASTLLWATFGRHHAPAISCGRHHGGPLCDRVTFPSSSG